MKMLMSVALAALACVAVAEEPRLEPSRRPGGAPRPMAMEAMRDPIVQVAMNPRLAEKIGLSAEQTAKLREIEKSSREGAKDQRGKMRAVMERQSKLMQAEKIDEAAVMAAIDELFEVRKEMAKAQTRRVIAVKAILTPEQVARALEEVKEMRERRPPRAPRGPKSETKPAAMPEKAAPGEAAPASPVQG